MKTIKFNKIVMLLLALVVVTSCVKDDDFDTPDLNIEEPNINPADVIQIPALAGILEQSDESIVSFSETGKYVSGYVVSSDEGGNFFKQLIIQDNFENPTRGVKVLVDVSPLFVTYEVGRKVFIKLDGLAVGTANGVLSLGFANGNSIERISFAEREDFIIRSPQVETIVPKPLTIAQFSEENENLFIRLTDMQFNRNELGKTFAAEGGDQFDGERVIESCATGNSVVLSTSTFADFKGLQVPAETGSIDVILTRDFFDDFYTVYLNSPEGINFDSSERCDPAEINCGLAPAAGPNQLFFDNFETQTINTPISGNGWTNFVEAGSEAWEAYEDNGANQSLGISARCGSFNSGDASTISWLITPEIPLANANQATIEFKTSNSFADASEMEVLFSSDWDGTPENITSASWDLLADATIVQNSDPFPDWIFSGIVDLSCVENNGYFAFKYIGSGAAGSDGTYELDDIIISSF
tara:strand:- start:72234 stop:73643 length:1410 start_codon:yes stop_codon:yes gene_type:complete